MEEESGRGEDETDEEKGREKRRREEEKRRREEEKRRRGEEEKRRRGEGEKGRRGEGEKRGESSKVVVRQVNTILDPTQETKRECLECEFGSIQQDSKTRSAGRKRE
jgi:hypothetical protein